MTKKSKLVPRPFQKVSEKAVDRIAQLMDKKSKNSLTDLNAKVKRTYRNPRFDD